MRDHSLLAALASAFLWFGLCMAQSSDPGNSEALRRIFHMLEDLSNRVESLDNGIREVKNSIGKDTLKSNIDGGFQKLSNSLISCSFDEVEALWYSIKDECRDHSHNCSHYASCKDTFSGFKCTCRQGFIGDGVTCEDIDECSTASHDCLDGASCENTNGHYNCHCIEPEVGDGRTYCQIPNCKDLEGIGCVLPVYKRMDFQSALKNCEKEGGRLIEGITTLEQLNTLKYRYENSFNYDENKPLHHDVWIGIRHGKWISDGTPVNRTFWDAHPESFTSDEECTVVAFQLDPVAYWSMDNCAVKLPSLCYIP